MPGSLTSLKSLLSLTVIVVTVGGTLVWLETVDTPASDGGAASGAPPDNGDDGEGSDQGDAGNDGAAGGNGSDSGGGYGAGGDGSSGSGSGSVAGAGPGADGAGGGAGGSGSGGNDTPAFPPPPPGGLCGPQEFLGGLIPFINGLGDPNLLDQPPWLENLSDFADFLPFDTGPIIGPFLGALSTPATVVGGFNDTYELIADELPEECSMVSGDPHIVTHDRRRYDFQAVGEYWAFRSIDDTFGIQIRTVPYQSSGRASTVAGVAAQIDGQILVIDATADDPVTLDDAPLERGSAEFTDNGGGIFYLDDGVAVYWPDSQTTLTVTHLERPVLSLHFTIGEALHERVSGLMGNADGRQDNDIALPDGTAVDDDFEIIHGTFRDAWRVPAGSSWFAGPSAFRDDYPTEAALLTQAERVAARETCVAAGVISGPLLQNCMFDVAIAEEAALAELHAADQLRRMSLVDSSCQLELGSNAVMEGFGPGRLWQADPPLRIDAAPAWRFTLEDNENPEVSRIVVNDDVAIVIDTENGVHLVNGAGAVLNTFALSVVPDVEPLVVGESVFLATEEGLAGVGMQGSVCWHLLTLSDEEIVSVALAGDRIITTTEADDGAVSLVLALEPATGRILWERPLQANVQQFGARTPPALTADVGYFESAGGRVVALDLEDGEPLWTYEPDRRSNAITGLSVASQGVVVTGRSSGTALVATDSGEAIWQTGSQVGVPRAIAIGQAQVVIVGERGTEALEITSGDPVWVNNGPRVGGGTEPQPVISRDVVFAYGPDRQLLGIDIETGAEVARLDASPETTRASPYDEFVGDPRMLGNVLLTINQSGILEAFR